MQQLTEEQIAAINKIDTDLKTEIDKLDKTKMSDAQKAIKMAAQAKKSKDAILKDN